MLACILLLVAVLLVFHHLLIKPLGYWRRLGVKQLRPLDHVFTNWFLLAKKQSAATLLMDLYKNFPEERYYGLHQFNRPGLFVRDVDLLKQIMIKDADHFTEHRFTLPGEVDPLVKKNLISLKGQEWKDMRAILTPTFTGSKMRVLFQQISDYGQTFASYFEERGEEVLELEMQDTFTKFTNDVIACSVFGVRIDTLRDPQNDFYVKGRKATDITSFSKQYKFMMAMAAPKLYKFLNLRLLEKDEVEFFTEIITASIEARQSQGIVRKDMIHLLMEAKREAEESNRNSAEASKMELTLDDIVAQAFIFFFGGFESVSRLMCFMAHELAVNQDVQDRLREEIIDTNEACNGELTYEALTGMKYLDMVLSETLRKYPTQVATDRVCTKPYTIDPTRPGERPVTLETGTVILVPTFALHRDPELFPDPDKFDPERFGEANKCGIGQYSYQPFGLGPRSCIGNRFAMLETKVAFFYLLSKFEIRPIGKTVVPLVLLRNSFSLSAEGGFWLGLKKLQ